MKKFTLLRISAAILEFVGYLILLGGLVLGVLIFGFSYNIVPEKIKILSSSLLGLLGVIIWMFAYGFPLILAHIIQVSLKSYDNTRFILQKLDTRYQHKQEVNLSTDNEVAQWIKDNPEKGLNDYYSRFFGK